MKTNENLLQTLTAIYLNLKAERDGGRTESEAMHDASRLPSWTEIVIRPLVEELVRLTPEVEWETKEKYQTIGLRSECPVSGRHRQNGTTVGITFTFDREGGILRYDTGCSTTRYAPNSVGAINHLNNVTAPVTDMDTLVEFVRGQYESVPSPA